MKKTKAARIIKRNQYSDQWNVHNRIGNFVQTLDRLPDAAQAKKQQRRSAPAGLLEMVF